MSGSHKLAILAEERGIVYGEEHAHRRFVDRDRREGLRILAVGDRVADLEAVDADHRTDVTALHSIHIGLSKTIKDHELLDLMLLDNVIPLAKADLLTGPKFASGKLADSNTSNIRGIFKGGHLKLRRSLNHFRGRDFRKDSIQERSDVRGRILPIVRHPTLFGASENRLEIKLLVCGIQGAHKIENLFLNLVWTAIWLVHLVDNHDWLLAQFKGFLKHETGLRHAAFKSINKKKDTVRHVQHPFDLTSEVTMSRSVYNVYLDTFIGDRHVFSQNGDASFSLDVVVVENQLAQILRLTHQISLIDHPVHESCLAVIDVRDERDVPNVLHIP